MGCCDEKQKIERLSKISYAIILTCQSAGLLNQPMAVIKLIHDVYGPYYDGIPLAEAIKKGYKTNAKDPYNRIYRKFEPGDKLYGKNNKIRK